MMLMVWVLLGAHGRILLRPGRDREHVLTPFTTMSKFHLFRPACLALLTALGLSTYSATAQASEPSKRCSAATQEKLEIEFVNNSSQPVTFHWMDFNCAEGGGPSLPPGQRTKGMTFRGHVFLARGQAGQVLRSFEASRNHATFAVDDKLIAHVAAQGEPYTEGSCSPRTQGGFTVTFVNRLNEPITMQWIGFDCKVHVLRKIPAHGQTTEATFPGHIFRFVDSVGSQLRSLDVAKDELIYHISAD